MPSYDNLAGIYYDTQDQVLPVNGSNPPIYHTRSRSRLNSKNPSTNNLHEGLDIESFTSNSSHLDLASINNNNGRSATFYQANDDDADDDDDDDENNNDTEDNNHHHSHLIGNLTTPCDYPSKPSLSTLPPEILTHILQQVLISSDSSPAVSYPDLTRDFSRILTTCNAIYDAGIPILYRHVSFPHPQAFDKFRKSIEQTGYGSLVKVLDFSAFTSVGLGRTGKMMYEIQMVTSTTILRALELCPGLREFLVAESVDMDIDKRVLDMLVSMPYIDAVDFCGSTNSSENGFTNSLIHSSLAKNPHPIYHLTKLSFHGCAAVPPQVFDSLLPKLNNVCRLDLTHTQVTPQALLSIPASAKITHLSLAKCVQLNSNGLMNFLALHPATRYLEWLNIMYESTKPVPLSTKDFDTILEYLPPLKYLNLHGLPVRKEHLKYLETMSDELKSLSLGYANIPLQELADFLPRLTELKYLDLTGNPQINMWTVQHSNSIFNSNMGIDIFEFSADFIKKLQGITIPGFHKEFGKARRGWIFRKKDNTGIQNNPSQTTVTPSRPSGFSFSALAQDRMMGAKKKINTPPPIPPPPIDTEPSWMYVSRKINMNEIGLGGNMTAAACKERGIYSYYGYHI